MKNSTFLALISASLVAANILYFNVDSIVTLVGLLAVLSSIICDSIEKIGVKIDDKHNEQTRRSKAQA